MSVLVIERRRGMGSTAPASAQFLNTSIVRQLTSRDFLQTLDTSALVPAQTQPSSMLPLAVAGLAGLAAGLVLARVLFKRGAS